MDSVDFVREKYFPSVDFYQLHCTCERQEMLKKSICYVLADYDRKKACAREIWDIVYSIIFHHYYYNVGDMFDVVDFLEGLRRHFVCILSLYNRHMRELTLRSVYYEIPTTIRNVKVCLLCTIDNVFSYYYDEQDPRLHRLRNVLYSACKCLYSGCSLKMYTEDFSSAYVRVLDKYKSG